MHCTPSLQCAAPRGLWLFNNTSTPPWLVLKPKQQDANYQNQTWQTKTDSPFHCQTWISQSKTFLNPDLPDNTYPGTQEVSCVPTLPLTLVREWENLWVPGWTKPKGANIEMKAPNEYVVTVLLVLLLEGVHLGRTIMAVALSALVSYAQLLFSLAILFYPS